MHKRITALCLALCLLFAAVPANAGAATAQTVSAEAVSVNAGSTVYLNVNAENFANVASLDLYIYYDADVLSVSSTSNGSLLSGAQADVNTAAAGTIKLSAISLDGINGSGRLLRIGFQAAADCPAGTYPVKLAVGDAYGTDLAAVSIGSTDGSVTVNAAEQTETFQIYGYPSVYSLQKGDTLSYRIACAYPLKAFTGAEFFVEYDPEVFAFESCELESALINESAIYSVNSSVLGQVRITYASTEPVSTFYLVNVKLKVIADMDGTTTVTGRASNVYREDLTAYGPSSYSYSLTLTKLPEVIDYPNAFLQTEALVVGQQSTSVFTLEAGTGIAAADFTVTYDPAVLRCVSVANAGGEHGGMIVINDNYAEGKVRFSYVNMNTYQEEMPLVQITWEPLQSPGEHYEVTLSGVGVVDAQQNAVTLEYVVGTGCIHQGVVIPPTCTEDGCTTYTCTACGDSYVVDPVNMLGHDILQFEAKEPTCTESGWDAHEGCSRCDYMTEGQTYPALGHELIDCAAQAATCTGIGWDAYQICGRCSYSTYQEIAALGHRVIEEQVTLVDPLTVQNTGDNAFVVTDGTYYSNNHTANSSSEFTVTALYDCAVTLHYGVSSEQNYDKLYILLNGAEQIVISGEVTGQTLALSLTAGDVVTVRYAKDGSVDRFEDRGWASLEYEHVWASAFTDVPAESREPDCDNAVVCAYCEETVKEALGHSWTEGDCVTDKLCTVCEQVETAPGHSYETVVTAPTCTEQGCTTYTCTACGDSYVDDYVDALGHSWAEATCTAPKTCTVCGATEGDPLGHSYETVVTAPTCTEQGCTTYTCTACGDSYVDDYVDALGHSWAEATCTAPKTCTVCGVTEGDPLGHSYEAVVTAPTCTEQGCTTYTCTACGDSYVDDYVDATGHSYENYVCTHCGSIDEASLTAVMDLSGDGKVTAFDAQMLAEYNAGLRTLTEAQLAALGMLTPQDIVSYILGRYPAAE